MRKIKRRQSGWRPCVVSVDPVSFIHPTPAPQCTLKGSVPPRYSRCHGNKHLKGFVQSLVRILMSLKTSRVQGLYYLKFVLVQNLHVDVREKFSILPHHANGIGTRGQRVMNSSRVPLKTRDVEGRCTKNLSNIKHLPVGVEVRRVGPAQVSSSSLDHGSKLPGPLP
ncbi:hypothetical protein TNCV_4357961 [Trichonephila clavipes]|nr:hypothetical protein TNCV_4357961 [Trichonephila clavipes]